MASTIEAPGVARNDPADRVWPLQDYWARAGYWGLHLACLGVLFVEASAGLVALCALMIWGRMFGITAGYHRYFAHRSYKTSRPFAFALALLGCSALQKGPLWWAAGHRRHHRYSDADGDMHSPRRGLGYSHYGWIFSGEWDTTEVERIRDFAAHRELVWLNRYFLVPPVALAVVLFVLGGWAALLWGFVLPTVLLWHFTYTINSLAHRFGTQRYATGDDSRNNWFLGLLTLGEGWHNNHHCFMGAARQGFFWWEIDVTYYALRGLERLGLVWDIKQPPARLLAQSTASSGSTRIPTE